jgi:response regulator of citrate/malate metabolism
MNGELKFLIVDDDLLMITLFEKMCSNLNINLQKESSYEFLERDFESVCHTFDLCFIDLFIGTRKSIDLFEKQEHLLKNRNCILITSGTDFPLFQKALSFGFEEIIQKPFTVNSFNNLVQKFSVKRSLN